MGLIEYITGQAALFIGAGTVVASITGCWDALGRGHSTKDCLTYGGCIALLGILLIALHFNPPQ